MPCRWKWHWKDQIKCICSVKWLQLNWCPVDGIDTERVRLNIFVLLNDLRNIPALKININMKSWCPCRCSHWWWRHFSWQTWPCRSWKNTYCISGNVHVEKIYIYIFLHILVKCNLNIFKLYFTKMCKNTPYMKRF